MTFSQPEPDVTDAGITSPHLERFERIARLALAIGWTIVIMVLCWIPRGVMHKIEGNGTFFKMPNFDKVVHVGILVLFAVLWMRALQAPRRKTWVILGGALLTALTEAVQELPIVGRDATLGDVVADMSGVIIGVLIASSIEPWFSRLELRIRRTLFPHSLPVPTESTLHKHPS